MKPSILPLLLSALSLALCAAPSRAQIGTTGTGPGPSTPVLATFTIPTDTDPDSITFTSSGQTFAITDQTNPITGQLLTPGYLSGGGGLDIFAAVPGPPSVGTTIPIVEVDFFTTYTGPISLTSLSGVGSFTPWFAEVLNPPVGQAFRFFKTLPTQANINTTNPGFDPAEFAFFTLTPNNPNDPTFLSSLFTVTGYTSVQNVPEPGTCALLGGLIVTGGMAWRRRRRA